MITNLHALSVVIRELSNTDSVWIGQYDVDERLSCIDHTGGDTHHGLGVRACDVSRGRRTGNNQRSRTIS